MNGERHRTDGPAVITNDGYQAWFINGLPHRSDGPAIVRQNGDKEWWLNNTQINPYSIQKWLTYRGLNETDIWNEEVIAEFLLTFST